jgi:hypothetical protein
VPPHRIKYQGPGERVQPFCHLPDFKGEFSPIPCRVPEDEEPLPLLKTHVDIKEGTDSVFDGRFVTRHFQFLVLISNLISHISKQI